MNSVVMDTGVCSKKCAHKGVKLSLLDFSLNERKIQGELERLISKVNILTEIN